MFLSAYPAAGILFFYIILLYHIIDIQEMLVVKIRKMGKNAAIVIPYKITKERNIKVGDILEFEIFKRTKKGLKENNYYFQKRQY